jgi:hypothetical protein
VAASGDVESQRDDCDCSIGTRTPSMLKIHEKFEKIRTLMPTLSNC